MNEQIKQDQCHRQDQDQENDGIIPARIRAHYDALPVFTITETDRMTGAVRTLGSIATANGPAWALSEVLADCVMYPGLPDLRQYAVTVQDETGATVYDLEQLNRDNGVVFADMEDGLDYAYIRLTEQAFSSLMIGNGRPEQYIAHGVNEYDEPYEVHWDLRSDWDGVDEEDACDWDAPAHCVPLDE